MKQFTKVNIRPNVTMLSVLKFLEYETWYALAEFVDNAIASYQANEKILKKYESDQFKLVVDIEINDAENKITVRDNAAGIDESNYPRAFRAAEVPSDTSGLSELLEANYILEYKGQLAYLLVQDEDVLFVLHQLFDIPMIQYPHIMSYHSEFP